MASERASPQELRDYSKVVLAPRKTDAGALYRHIPKLDCIFYPLNCFNLKKCSIRPIEPTNGAYRPMSLMDKDLHRISRVQSPEISQNCEHSITSMCLTFVTGILCQQMKSFHYHCNFVLSSSMVPLTSRQNTLRSARRSPKWLRSPLILMDPLG